MTPQQLIEMRFYGTFSNILSPSPFVFKLFHIWYVWWGDMHIIIYFLPLLLCCISPRCALELRYQLTFTLHTKRLEKKFLKVLLKNFFLNFFQCNVMQCTHVLSLVCCYAASYASYFPLQILIKKDLLYPFLRSLLTFVWLLQEKNHHDFTECIYIYFSVSGHKILCGCKTSNSWMEIKQKEKWTYKSNTKKITCHAIRNGLLLRYIEMLRREASRKVIVLSHSLANRTIANIILWKIWFIYISRHCIVSISLKISSYAKLTALLFLFCSSA
jgi:hypothetical protein